MKTLNRKAFTMMELIFVIVVIGILSAIAIPKLAVTRDDAVVTKARATVSALRSAIATERQKRILRGNFTAVDGETAVGLLQYGLDSGWSRSTDTFTFTGPGSTSCSFEVDNNRLTKKSGCRVSGMGDL